ncbi:MAG: hypothetical protein R2726_16995 [Acidimicrobiales bacterium]
MAWNIRNRSTSVSEEATSGSTSTRLPSEGAMRASTVPTSSTCSASTPSAA